jgi:hypothetical protein
MGKNWTLDNVQQVNYCTNEPLSQTFRSYIKVGYFCNNDSEANISEDSWWVRELLSWFHSWLMIPGSGIGSVLWISLVPVSHNTEFSDMSQLTGINVRIRLLVSRVVLSMQTTRFFDTLAEQSAATWCRHPWMDMRSSINVKSFKVYIKWMTEQVRV